MNEATVLYFSGTGNSKYVAKLVGGPLYSINEGIKNRTWPEKVGDTVVFVMPVYAWQMPRVVRDWIRRGDIFAGKKAYFLVTCGSGIGDAQKYVCQLCAERGMTFMGCAQIVMPENYIAMFDCPSEEKSLRIVQAAERHMAELVPLIVAGKPLPEKRTHVLDRFLSGPINEGFYKFYISSKKFYAKDSCTGCGKCAVRCPLNNIKLEAGRPVWGDACTHCMACICDCPAEAIEYGRTSRGKRRYHCPK